MTVKANITGLQGGTTYHYRLEANSNGPAFGEDATLTTLPLAVIESTEATNVTAETAELHASINPEGVPVTSSCSNTAPKPAFTPPRSNAPSAAQIGGGSVSVLVSGTLSKLTANETYHWRVVIEDENGTSGEAVNHTFVYDTSGETLPDNRA